MASAMRARAGVMAFAHESYRHAPIAPEEAKMSIVAADGQRGAMICKPPALAATPPRRSVKASAEPLSYACHRHAFTNAAIEAAHAVR